MANGLLDMLSGAIGTTPPAYLEGLLGAQATEDLRKRSIGSGLVNALVGYAAMPKNQNLGLGRILAGAAQAGMQGAQGVYSTALQDYQTQVKIAEMKRQQAIQDRELQRQTETEKLAPQLFQTIPAQYREVDGSPYFIPKPAEEGAVAPEYGMQRVIPEPTQELVSPARTTLNMNVAQRIASLSKDPLAAYKNIAETVPALRKAGMIQMQGQQDNPFEIFSTGAQSPTVQKLAQKYQTSYENGTLDQETAEKRILELGKMDETYIDRVARGEDRDLAREQNAANQAISRQIAKGNLDLRRDMQSQPLDSSAVDFAAQMYLKTGVMPSLGAGSSKMRQEIIARAAEINAGTGMTAAEGAEQMVANKATSAGILQLQKQKTMVGAFEKNAMRNADIALRLSSQADRTGVPVFNRWLQAGQKSIAGNPTVSAFNAANETFVNEYAKIMSGSMGNTPVSDSARQHAHEMLSTTQTKEQYQSVVKVLKEEMKNRMVGFEEELKEAKRSLSPSKSTGSNVTVDAVQAELERRKRGNQ
jgi:hypothetical protein